MEDETIRNEARLLLRYVVSVEICLCLSSLPSSVACFSNVVLVCSLVRFSSIIFRRLLSSLLVYALAPAYQ